MLDNSYYKGYEGEGEIKIWSDEKNKENENGMIIWVGFFNTILEGCYSSEFSPNGIIHCYFNQDGFYDDIWEMQYPDIVLEELEKFDEKVLNTKNEEIIKKVKEIIKQLVDLINTAVENGRNIFIEYI